MCYNCKFSVRLLRFLYCFSDVLLYIRLLDAYAFAYCFSDVLLYVHLIGGHFILLFKKKNKNKTEQK